MLKTSNQLVVTVSQLNRKIALMMKQENTFSNLCVKGEISNLTIHHKSGHIYFSLKDAVSSVRAIMFNSDAQKLDFLPEDGMSVIVCGVVQCYEKEGIYQIKASEMIPQGAGAQAAALEQLKQKLDKEGLFSQKRKLPEFPEKICVITAETGAALQDILNILNRRYPIATVVVIPVLVQGEKAPESIVKALQKSGKTGADVVIFGRGGGSAEDLSAFNNEQVVRAVFNSSIPTISAVGHETDISLSDFAADLRAPTPSAAAELAVPDIRELFSVIAGYSEFIKIRTAEIIRKYETDTELYMQKIEANSPVFKILSNEQAVIRIFNEISDKYKTLISHKEHLLNERISVITALNPLSVLARGYSIVYKNDKAVMSVDDVVSGDEVRIRTANGEIIAVVK